jgi:lipopolysaccharide transport system permease protein
MDSLTSPNLTSPKPHLTIQPTAGWQAINLRELWQFRDLLTTLAQRDVKLRYRQTALGVVWVVLQPLIAAVIFSFVFGKVAKLPAPHGVPYLVFSYAGLLAWNAFNSTLGKTSACLLANSNLVSKVYFPRLALPLSTVFSTLIDFGVALVMMVVLMVINHVVPTLAVLLLPVWLLLVILLALGVGLYMSALMVSYRDVQYILPVATQFLLYASPIAYSAALIPVKYKAIFMANPLTGLLEAFRWSMLGTAAPNWDNVAYAAAVSVLVFVLGAFSFKKMERKFADVI